MNMHLASGTFGLVALALLAGCSLINAPSDLVVGTGGEAGTTTTGGEGGTGGRTTTSEPPECTIDDDCQDKGSECADATCGADGTCVVSPRPAGTPCGMAPTSSCDLADSCDGAGNCVRDIPLAVHQRAVHVKEDGVYLWDLWDLAPCFHGL